MRGLGRAAGAPIARTSPSAARARPIAAEPRAEVRGGAAEDRGDRDARRSRTRCSGHRPGSGAASPASDRDACRAPSTAGPGARRAVARSRSRSLRSSQAPRSANVAPTSVISSAAAPCAFPTRRLPTRSESAVGRARRGDAEVGVPRPPEVLHGASGNRREHADRRRTLAGPSRPRPNPPRNARLRHATNRTRSPSSSSAGGLRRGSNSASGVRPMTCQPPGEASG